MLLSLFYTLIHSFFIVLLLIGGFVYSNLNTHEDIYLYMVSILSVILFVWQIWSWKKVTKKLFSPYTLFLLASMLFNSGQAFLFVLGLNDNYLNGMFRNEIVIKTLYLVIMCHAFLHLGALTAWNARKKRPTALLETNTLKRRSAINLVGWSLFVISIVPTLLNLKQSISIVSSSGYMGVYQQQASVGFGVSSDLLAQFIIPAILFLLAGSKAPNGNILKINIIAASVTMMIYSFAGFFVGSRAALIMPLLAFAWVWHKCIKPIPKTTLAIAGVIFLFFVFPTVSLLRGNTGEERMSFSSMWEAFGSLDNPLVAIINEMGFSMNTISHTLNLIPTIRPFDYGEGYFYALTTAFPNLFWDIHPAVAHGKFANWLIWEVDPYIANIGGGLGYSYIAEAYANFGYILAPVFMYIFGLLIVNLFLWAELSHDSAKIAMVGSFLSVLLFVVRDETATIIRPLLWYATIPYIGVLIFERIGRLPKKFSHEKIPINISNNK